MALSEPEADFDGDPVSARDALATGEGFVDAFCPPALLKCGADEGDAAITVQALVVREVDGKLVLAVPASAWHRKVSKRTLPKGFLTKVAAAEVAACAASDRGSAVEGVALRVWFGLVEPAAEGALEISEEVASVSFGSLPGGSPALPYVPALVAAVNDSFSFGLAEWGAPADASGPLTARLDRLERMISSLHGVKVPEAKGQARAKSKAAPKAAAKPQAVRGSLDPSVAAAAKAAGVPPATLAEFERLLGQPTGSRFAPEPALPTAAEILEESEGEGVEEDDGAGEGAAGSGYPALRQVQPKESSLRSSLRPQYDGGLLERAGCKDLGPREGDGRRRRWFGRGFGPAGWKAQRISTPSPPRGIGELAGGDLECDRAADAGGHGLIGAGCRRDSADQRQGVVGTSVSRGPLREQMDFSERRQKLQKGQAAPPNQDLVSETSGEAAAAAPGRPPRSDPKSLHAPPPT